MKAVKLIGRRVSRIIAGFVGFVALYLFSAQVLSYLTAGNTTGETGKETVTIYVQSNGVHTDIIVPVKSETINWNDTFAVNTFEQADTGYRYISFGWGDKGFYLDTPTWDDLKFSTAFKAAFFMSSTAMHVTYRKKEAKQSASCIRLELEKEKYQALCKEIMGSFEKKEGAVQLIAHPGYGSNDNFYEAEGTYSLFKTCNVWTGRTLLKSGVRVGLWTPFEWNVLGSLKD